jgi:hypothetical protein
MGHAGCSVSRQIVKLFTYARLKFDNSTHQMNAELVSEGNLSYSGNQDMDQPK